MDLRLDAGVSIMQVNASQQGRTINEKEEFYYQLQEIVNDMKYQENIILCGDWNGHIGVDRTTYEMNIGAYSIGNRNEAGQRLLDFVKINNFRIMNTFYKHRESHK